jgi:hypothetical protein
MIGLKVFLIPYSRDDEKTAIGKTTQFSLHGT